ncbi:MAG: NAD(P)-dependent oxidoreductase [candidate division Zixibacteria bacterium]|jgi:nucleoside-diphosphate-sugar epimerase|nr:NAD(P)-dependent oxidoreductase [candidate division Zixibacteria bacterium]
MKSCIIFGGSGFVGTHLARHLLETGRFNHIQLADIQPSSLTGLPGISFSRVDVRKPIPLDLVADRPEWIFNLAAIHREPGHTREEYFDTNLAGAHNVCMYAEACGCNNIYFTSSISVYGPTTGPTDERRPIQPSTPYGGSKYPAELIHDIWRQRRPGRRLLISRPGVLYGPGDPGNILRMINAVKRGYFAFPGSSSIHKSYGYIYGFLDSIDFVMDSPHDFLVYNYVETPTQPLAHIVAETKRFLGSRAITVSIPLWLLLPIASAIQKMIGFRNPIHPVPVRKAATPTHIVPQTLMEMGYTFRYSFAESLRHWLTVAPEDFGYAPAVDPESKRRLRLRRGVESADSEVPVTARRHSRMTEKESVAGR